MLAAVILTIAGCGGDSGSETTTADATPSQARRDTAPPDDAAGTRDVGCLLLGYYDVEDNSRKYDLPPLSCDQQYVP